MMAHTGLPESLPIGDAEPPGFEESIPDWVSMSSDDLDVTDPEPAGLDKRINQLRRSLLAMQAKSLKLAWRLDHLCRTRSRLRERQRVSDGTATLKRHSRTKGVHESVSVAESSTVIEIQVSSPHAKSPVAVSCIVGDSSVEGRLVGEPVSAQNDSEAVGISVQNPSLEEGTAECKSRCIVSPPPQTDGELSGLKPLGATAPVVLTIGSQEPESEEVSSVEAGDSGARSSCNCPVDVFHSDSEEGLETDDLAQPVETLLTLGDVSEAVRPAGIVAEASGEAAAVIQDAVSAEELPEMTNVERIVGSRLSSKFIPQSIGLLGVNCMGFRISIEEYAMVLRALVPSGNQIRPYHQWLCYQHEFSAVIFKGFPYGIGEDEYMRAIFTFNGILDDTERLQTVVAVKAQYPDTEHGPEFNGMVFVTFANRKLAELAMEFWNGAGIKTAPRRTIVVNWSNNDISPGQNPAIACSARYDQHVWNFRAALDDRLYARCGIIPYPMKLMEGSRWF